jgi:hypothetical protein
MVVAIRLLFLLLSAVTVAIAKGLGVVVLLAAGLLGWRRSNPAWLLAVAVVGAIAGHEMFADLGGAGKTGGALSNGVFLFCVCFLMAGAGYLAGRSLRHWRETRRSPGAGG